MGHFLWKRVVCLLLALILVGNTWAGGKVAPFLKPSQSTSPNVAFARFVLNTLHAASVDPNLKEVDLTALSQDVAGLNLDPALTRSMATLSLQSQNKLAQAMRIAQKEGLDIKNWTPTHQVSLLDHRPTGNGKATVLTPLGDESPTSVSDAGQQALVTLQQLDQDLGGISLAQLTSPNELEGLFKQHNRLGRFWNGVAPAPDPTLLVNGHSPNGTLSYAHLQNVVPGNGHVGQNGVSNTAGNGAIEIPVPEKWAEVLADSRKLRPPLETFARRRQKELGLEGFRRAVSKDQIAWEDNPALGRAELTHIDGWDSVRVTHASTELAVLFLDGSRIRPDSTHLRKFIARMHHEAGRRRKDDQRGRDLLIVWEENGAVVNMEYRPRHRWTSGAWWVDYWYAKVQKPEPRDLIVAFVFGVLAQGVLALVLAGIKIGLGPPVDFWYFWFIPIPADFWNFWFTPIFTMGFGAFIGLIVKTYMNWTKGDSRKNFDVLQILRLSTVSLAFAFPVLIATHGFAALNLLSVGGWLLLGHLIMNTLLKNFGKIPYQQISDLGRANREFAEEATVLGMPRDVVVNQSLYLINWTVSLADLILIPRLGKVLLILSILIMRPIVLKYAEKYNFAEASMMRRRWEREKYLIFAICLAAAALAFFL